MKYKVIPYKGIYSKRGKLEGIASDMESIMNDMESKGYEFVSVSTVNIAAPPGCFGRLIGMSTTYEDYNFLIFKNSNK